MPMSVRAALTLALAVVAAPLVAQNPPPTPWRTDFTKYTVHPDSFAPAGQRDGIPSLVNPAFVSIAEAGAWLSDREPVAVVTIGTDIRAYPIQIMMQHDVANDVVGGVPVVVTYCPLCGSALAYDRRVDGEVLEFGYAGRLNHSNLVVYDRQTETWWGQVIGEGLVGKHAGRKLTFIPAPVMSFREFKAESPNGRVLSRDTGHDRPYGRGRLGYDEDPNPIRRFFSRETDVRLPAKERVMVIEGGTDIVAVPYTALMERKVIATEVNGREVVVLWGPGTASVYGERTATGKDVGAALAYDPLLEGRRLRFREAGEGVFTDRETGSTWNLLGRAVNGPLTGKRLTPVDHGVHFWFVWAAYRPATRVVQR